MAYAYVQDLASSWEQYRGVAAALVEPLPDGLLVHVAGPTDEGVRVIAVWDSEDAWERFRSERLEPALAELGGPARQPTFRGLHPEQVLLRQRVPALTSAGRKEE